MNTTSCTRTLILLSACVLFILPSCRWRKKDGDMPHKESAHSVRHRKQPVKTAQETVHQESRRSKRRSRDVSAKPAGEKKGGFWSWFGGNKKEGAKKTMTRAERRAQKNAKRATNKATNGKAVQQHITSSAKEKMNDGHGDPSNSRYSK